MEFGAARDEVEVEVAVAAIIRDGKLLLGHRHPLRRWYPDCWDLVGGHLEPGETAEEAILLECREELGIMIREPRPIEVPFEIQDVIMHGFLITSWHGHPVNAAPDEHDALAWFSTDELNGLHLADDTYSAWLPTLIESARPTG